ncbi:MAG: lytic transglycosylase domain-containing protein [Bacteroidales bacterium]|nr:lytic transglycosylase domain-containing protein [Bacteroidales bacterium]
MRRILIFIILLKCFSAYAVDLDIIKNIESSGNPKAYNSTSNARGLYQITPICLKEWNNFNPKETYTQDDLFDPAINRKIADWYLHVRIPKMIKHYKKYLTDRNILIAYNAGISYVVSGKELPEETKSYIQKYIQGGK